MSYTYLYDTINFISIWDGYVTLIYNNKQYEYQLESNNQYYEMLIRNSFPLSWNKGVRKVKLSLLSELRNYKAD